MKYFNIILMSAILFAQTILAEQPTVSGLLSKYKETQKCWMSYISKEEDKAELEMTSLNQPKFQQGVKLEIFEKIELRCDSKNYYSSRKRWGDFPELGGKLNEDQVGETQTLWNGELNFQFHDNPDISKARLYLTRKENVDINQVHYICDSQAGGPIRGSYYGSGERIDAELEKANSISVRPEKEKINGSDCFVIEAKDKRSEFVIWIDPEHGYNIVQARVKRNSVTANDPSEYENPPMGNSQVELKNVVLKNIDGVWLPVECDYSIGMKENSGNLSSSENHHHKITEISINPDHEVLKSFDPERFVKNGSRVQFIGLQDVLYIWQDGKLVPNINKEVVSELDKIANDIMLESNKDSAETLKGILEKYTANQDKFKSFIANADTSIESSGTLQTEKSEFRTNGSKVNHRSTITDKLSSKETSTYSSFLWDGQSLIQYKNNMVLLSKLENDTKRLIVTEYRGAPLLGICGGDSDRLDTIISKVDTAILKPTTELIDDAQCYLIESNTNTDRYKVWFNPQKGYNIAKIEIKRSSNNGVTSFSMQNVRFERINGIWVPMEADIQQTTNSKLIKWHHKRTEMLLNPDHGKLNSFVADDIPNGTKVSATDNSNVIWQNGVAVQKGR